MRGQKHMQKVLQNICNNWIKSDRGLAMYLIFLNWLRFSLVSLYMAVTGFRYAWTKIFNISTGLESIWCLDKCSQEIDCSLAFEDWQITYLFSTFTILEHLEKRNICKSSVFLLFCGSDSVNNVRIQVGIGVYLLCYLLNQSVSQ